MRIVLTVLYLIMLLMPAAALALQQQPPPFVPLDKSVYQGSQLQSAFTSTSSDDAVASFFLQIFKLVPLIIVGVAVLRGMWAGGMKASGKDSWQKNSDANAILGNVALGFFLAVGMGLFFMIVNPAIFNFNILKDFGSAALHFNALG